MLAARLGLRHASEESVARVLSKPAQRAALHVAGLDPTPFRVAEAPAALPAAVAAVGVPAVVKPVRGAGGAATYRVTSPAEARVLAERIDPARFPYVAEHELQPHPDLVGAPWGDYVSVESVVVDGVAHALAVTGKAPLAPPYREQGGFVPAALDADAERDVVDLAARAVVALGFEHGLVHTEPEA
ncbi:hypothetical protein G5V59_10445 [Nocardioides sp. W3-2-3]|uniref:hypothetical protein n=1 Tax=Nocardioides convexus TaxID=2712224 RepID=UPI0024187941|nr:hypothetical protein [Nocardioides convexus]NHA00372.1 hypothetical protein [Nocardioides convexus]